MRDLGLWEYPSSANTMDVMTTLTTGILMAATATTAAGLATGVIRAYRRDFMAAQNRLSAVRRHYISTAFGTLEYAESGAGDPVLVSHGIFHGCDGGLLSVGSILHGHRIIAPSRFGYLGSGLPAGASPRDQADAFAALLDHLHVLQVDMVGPVPPPRSSSPCIIRTERNTSSSCPAASPAIRWRLPPRCGRSCSTPTCRCGS